MARKREAVQPTEEQAPAAEPSAPATQPAAPAGQDPAPAAADAGQATRSRWLARFDSWGDHEAGVVLLEDRENRRMALKFSEKPSEAVREVMKGEPFGFRFDPDEQLWYKKYNATNSRKARTDAEQLGFTVANIIREEKGLEQKVSFSLGL